MNKEEKYIIWDMDGTLTNPTPFLHLIENTPKDWDTWNKCLILHDPIETSLHLYKMHFRNDDKNIIVTARRENARIYTENWLEKHELHMQHFGLYMRQENDFRPDYEIKLDILRKLRADNKNIFMAYDDRGSVVQMYRDNGVICHHVTDGGF